MKKKENTNENVEDYKGDEDTGQMNDYPQEVY